MLLTDDRDSADGADRRDPEAGSALAAVIGVIAVTAVIAMSLLATTVFAVGLSTGGRASVQAEAAAEAGIDYARARIDQCAGGALPVAPAGSPSFTLQVQYRADTGNWKDGCPDDLATQVHLVSTGYPDGQGPPTSTPQDARTIDAVLDIVVATPARRMFPDVAMGVVGLQVPGGTAATDTTAAVPAADVTLTGTVSTAGDVTCDGTLRVVGDLHVKDKLFGCPAPSGTLFNKAPNKYAAASPFNVFPQIVAYDPRLPNRTRLTLPQAMPLMDPYNDPQSCVIQGWAATPVNLGDIVIDARNCPKVTIQAVANVNLTGDLIWLVNDFDLSGYINVTSDPNAPDPMGEGFAVYIIRPWDPANPTTCAPGLDHGISLSSGGFTTGPRTKVMLYSTAGVDVRSSVSMTGQIYGCDVRIGGTTRLDDGQFGAMIPKVNAGLRLVSQADVPPAGS
jgi:hypothetical protein